jgi:Fe-S cluster biogenesis protein NfuA
MFIQTEPTPNPATLKFLPGGNVMTRGTANFESADRASASPLATRLFETEGVEGIYLGADFITVTKAENKNWDVLKPLILGAIMEHFTAGKPVMKADAANADAGHSEAEGEDAVIAQIKELLDTRVRPAVANDGGDIVYRDFKDGIVYLNMQGACSGCPSSTMTLKSGIENMLKHYIPEIIEVQSVD